MKEKDQTITKDYLDNKLDEGLSIIGEDFDKKIDTVTKIMLRGFDEAKKEREAARQDRHLIRAEMKTMGKRLEKRIDESQEELAIMVKAGFDEQGKKIDRMVSELPSLKARVLLLEEAI